MCVLGIKDKLGMIKVMYDGVSEEFLRMRVLYYCEKEQMLFTANSLGF